MSVVDTLLSTIDTYGPPASTLTDNGPVYTARHGGSRNEYEHVVAALSPTQKSGAPNHPRNRGKIERFRQTLERWLATRQRATTITALQPQLDEFRDHYSARPNAPAAASPRDRLNRDMRSTASASARHTGQTLHRKRRRHHRHRHSHRHRQDPRHEHHRPNNTYWRNKEKEPVRWPGSPS
ncbi:integrase core domain-containing protein [Microbacterium arborescens]|uniref:integrase core domain-containing protein n=1 Tax=Microbacterium arborescens TaxID=33883 RepID=UPI001428C2D9|nr:integrase core domain-containing protein [Microbacterium arborescens]